MNEVIFFGFTFKKGVAERFGLFVDRRLVREGGVGKLNRVGGGSAKLRERDVPRVPVGNGHKCVVVGNGVLVEPLAE